MKNLASHLKGVSIIILIICGYMLLPALVFARITPEDIVNGKKAVYQQKIVNYSSVNQEKLKTLSEKIAQVNKKRTDELDKIMSLQVAILDEYEKRQNGKNAEKIKTSRYWVTFAHEAVAYQAAKIYVFNLSYETNIKNDILSTLGLFQSELNYARGQVIHSQQILKETVK